MSTRYLITDSVPLNGGDEAMLRALVESIHARWPEVSITILCKDIERCRTVLPDLEFASDLAFIAPRDHATYARIRSLYEAADLVISSPGGFLNDYYEIEGRLRGIELAHEAGTPVVLFGQSIGPIWKDRSRDQLSKVLNRCRTICVRDALSLQTLRDCGIEEDRIRRSTDVAFLWRHLAPEPFRNGHEHGAPARLIGLSLRLWPLHDPGMHEHIVDSAAKLVTSLLEADPKRRVNFLSTCQGTEGYKDDSLVAIRVLERLDQLLRDRCSIDRARHSTRELIRRLGRHDAFIGMRLHACLLAMLGGCPAFGLGYETKTREIFTDLGFASNQIDFEADSTQWIMRTAEFLDHLDQARLALPGALDRAAARVDKSLRLLDPAFARRGAGVTAV
jgi:colanic acid/amylovoran biosynthesis protein